MNRQTDGGQSDSCVHSLAPHKPSLIKMITNEWSSNLHSALWEVESFLHDGRQFPDPAALLAQDVLSTGGQDDNFRPGGRHTHLHAAVAIFRQLTS